MRPIFIVLEGIDGSGKSSAAQRLKEFLESEGMRVMVTAEPTKGMIGKMVAECDDLSPETEALLFTADRACHTQEIKGWMDEGLCVISDRYFGSTLAYQSASGMDLQWLKAINSKVVMKPDFTFLLDVDPEISFGRVGTRGEEKSRFERLDYQRKVRDAYLGFAEEFDYIRIDASLKPKEVADRMISIISMKG